MADGNGKVITLICERAVNLDAAMDESGRLKDLPDCHVVKFPCSGMIQPLMVEAALKAGAEGVIVCGCQLGDCYYREGNRMIRERLLGSRPPGLKKTVDRRRVIALWLSRPQSSRFLSEAKEFIATLRRLPAADVPAPKPEAPAAKPEPAAKPAEKPEPAKPVTPAAEKPATAKASDQPKAPSATEPAAPSTASDAPSADAGSSPKPEPPPPDASSSATDASPPSDTKAADSTKKKKSAKADEPIEGKKE